MNKMITTREEYNKAVADMNALHKEIEEYERMHDQYGVRLTPVTVERMKKLFGYWKSLTSHRMMHDGLFDHLKALTSLEDDMRAEFSEDEIRTCFHMFGNTPSDEMTNPMIFARKYGDILIHD
jgi:hypothetical protein